MPSTTTLNPPAIAGPSAATPMPLCWDDLVPHRGFLIQFARSRTQDPALAEDLVHDVFEAAMTGRAPFLGLSGLRTWLVGVLRHKLIDLARQARNVCSLELIAPEEDERPVPAALVDPGPSPEQDAEHRERLQRTLASIQKLPKGLRKAVELRLLLDSDTQDVCSLLAISETNLFVRLHRARKLLLDDEQPLAGRDSAFRRPLPQLL